MKILVFEKHIGMGISHYLFLKNMGYDVDLILSINETHYLNSWGIDINTMSKEYNEAKNRLEEISKFGIVDIIKNKIKMNKPPIYDVVLTSFPPTNIIFLEACNLGKINHVNLSNKFDIHSSNAVTSKTNNSSPRFPSFEERSAVHEYFEKTEIKITSCTKVDKEYYRYYFGKDIQHIPFIPYQAYKHFSIEYENKLIGLFPTNSFYLDNNMEIFNKIIEYGEKYKFKFLYKKNYDFLLSTKDMANTMCNVVIPYNYFSVSQSEASFLSPSIYPDDNFIINNKTIYTDSAIFPNYSHEQDSLDFDLNIKKFGKFSPQSYKDEDQRHWLKFSEYSDNSINKFKDIENLFSIIEDINFKESREALDQKNKAKIQYAQNIWSSVYS